MELRTLIGTELLRPGLHELADDLTLDVIDGTHSVTHINRREQWPADVVLEPGYRTGQVFAFHLRDALVDLEQGAIYDANGALIRESFGPVGTAGRHVATLPARDTVRRSTLPILPLGSPRARNPAHWYLDSLSKPVVVARSRLAPLAPKPMIYRARAGFQRDSLRLLDGEPAWLPDTPRFVRGDVVGTPGINAGGSPRVSDMVVPYADVLAERRRAVFGGVPGCGPRIFVSRAGAGYRGIVNEAAFADALAAEGFVSLRLEELHAAEQMTAFAEAEVVVSPHGAGLIHMLWMNRRAPVVEIFPDGGIHGSIYSRIASRRRQPYFAIAGRAVGNRDPRANPKNADLEIDVAGVLDFLRGRVLGGVSPRA